MLTNWLHLPNVRRGFAVSTVALTVLAGSGTISAAQAAPASAAKCTYSVTGLTYSKKSNKVYAKASAGKCSSYNKVCLGLYQGYPIPFRGWVWHTSGERCVTFTGVTTSISWNVSGKCSSAVYYAAVAPYRGDKPAGKIKNSKLHNIVC